MLCIIHQTTAHYAPSFNSYGPGTALYLVRPSQKSHLMQPLPVRALHYITLELFRVA